MSCDTTARLLCAQVCAALPLPCIGKHTYEETPPQKRSRAFHPLIESRYARSHHSLSMQFLCVCACMISLTLFSLLSVCSECNSATRQVGGKARDGKPVCSKPGCTGELVKQVERQSIRLLRSLCGSGVIRLCSSILFFYSVLL